MNNLLNILKSFLWWKLRSKLKYLLVWVHLKGRTIQRSTYLSICLSIYGFIFVRRMRDWTSWRWYSCEAVSTKLLPLYLKMNLDIPMQVVGVEKIDMNWRKNKRKLEPSGMLWGPLGQINTTLIFAWLWWYRFAEAEALIAELCNIHLAQVPKKLKPRLSVYRPGYS